jgi:hypothetical protein
VVGAVTRDFDAQCGNFAQAGKVTGIKPDLIEFNEKFCINFNFRCFLH